MGWALSSRPALAAARSIIRAKPAVVNGEPRSLTNTKGDDGLWCRCTSDNRKLWVAQQSSGFLHMLCKGSALVCQNGGGERKARPRRLETTKGS
jgi:hypothetical protein